MRIRQRERKRGRRGEREIGREREREDNNCFIILKANMVVQIT